MWPRTSEFMIGVWLLLSPFVFGHPPGAAGLWATDLACGALVLLFSSLSCLRRTRRAHLLELPVVGWLLGHGYLAGGHPGGPGYQNELLVGLVLALLVIIPSQANVPPRSWRRYYAERARARAG